MGKCVRLLGLAAAIFCIAASPPATETGHGKLQAGHVLWIWNTFDVAYGGANLVVKCPAKYDVVGGGFNAFRASAGSSVSVSAPNADFTAWTVSVSVHQSAHVTVYAACLPA